MPIISWRSRAVSTADAGAAGAGATGAGAAVVAGARAAAFAGVVAFGLAAGALLFVGAADAIEGETRRMATTAASFMKYHDEAATRARQCEPAAPV
jgi:hypothetical protein